MSLDASTQLENSAPAIERFISNPSSVAPTSMMSPFTARQSIFRYGVAAAFLTVALICAWLTREILAQNVTLLFFVAVVISAMYGGRGPGLMAALISTLFIAVLMHWRWGSVGIDRFEAVRLGVFFVLAVAVGWLNALRREAQQELWLSRDQLELRVAARTASLREANVRLGQEILDHQKTARTCLESEARKAAIVETSLDCLITTDRRGLVIEFNGTAERTLGYQRAQAIGRRLADILLPPDLHDFYGGSFEAKEPATYNVAMNGRVEINATRKDGTTFPAELDVKRIELEDGPIFSVCVRDITERKRWEEKLLDHQLRLRDLAAQLSRSEEVERRRVAGQLHDNIGQLLAVVKIEIELLSQDAETPENVREAVARSNELLQQAISHTRSLTFDLCPPVLYEGGLEAGLIWLGEQWGKQHSLAVHVMKQGWSGTIDDELRGFFFQAVRELLLNVVKHARAKRVFIRLGEAGGRLRVCVEDDGIGLPTATGVAGRKSDGFGLFSIRERLRSYGGQMKVDSSPDRGTSVELEVPANEMSLM